MAGTCKEYTFSAVLYYTLLFFHFCQLWAFNNYYPDISYTLVSINFVKVINRFISRTIQYEIFKLCRSIVSPTITLFFKTLNLLSSIYWAHTKTDKLQSINYFTKCEKQPTELELQYHSISQTLTMINACGGLFMLSLASKAIYTCLLSWPL